MIKRLITLVWTTGFFLICAVLCYSFFSNRSLAIYPVTKSLIIANRPASSLDRGLNSLLSVEREESVLWFDGELDHLGAQLEARLFIRDQWTFDVLAGFYDLKGRLNSGVYQIEASDTTLDIIRKLSDGHVSRFLVVNPGESLSEINQRLKSYGVQDDLVTAAHQEAFTKKCQKYYGLKVTEPEGFIYPGFYSIDVTSFKADVFLKDALSRFDRQIGKVYRFDEALLAKLPSDMAKSSRKLRRIYFNNEGSSTTGFAVGAISARGIFGGAF